MQQGVLWKERDMQCKVRPLSWNAAETKPAEDWRDACSAISQIKPTVAVRNPKALVLFSGLTLTPKYVFPKKAPRHRPPHWNGSKKSRGQAQPRPGGLDRLSSKSPSCGFGLEQGGCRGRKRRERADEHGEVHSTVQ